MSNDLISLICLGEPPDNEDLTPLSKENGFNLRHYPAPESSFGEIASGGMPDIVLVFAADRAEHSPEDNGDFVENTLMPGAAQRMEQLRQLNVMFSPGIFLVLDRIPEARHRQELLESGYNGFLIRPFTAEEIRLTLAPFLDKKNLSQRIDTMQQTQEKSLAYLDRFKGQLAALKQELISEKTSLNNALKQIQALNLERDRMKKQMAQVKQDLDQNVKGFVDILAALIKTKVETNRNHCERVAHIACHIGRQMGIDENQLEDLRKAGMLHEIGLLFMPEPVREARASALQNDILIQYPVKGADLIEQCTCFTRVARIIRFMNENSDGTGYPKGLKKRYIPLLSRILAGADVFERLKDDPDNNNLEALLEALEQEAGARLDPVIAGWLEKYAVLHMGAGAWKIRSIGIAQLEPGMRLGTALFTATGTKLFSAGTLLTREAIDKIIKYNREYPVDETIYIKV